MVRTKGYQENNGHQNVSFKEAARIKKSNIVNSAFSYSDKLLSNNHNSTKNINFGQETDA